ncbi:MAG TPA: ComEC/Rec2 family competence protein [Thermoanaerobaculaceae bacterium]|nr:ComEC/Rec2 family competence protein [Thermoanaerobaculaceae bacterium]
MSKSSRTSGAPAPDLPGSRLVALAVSAVVAAVTGNVLPPDPVFRYPLALLALLAGWRGLRRSDRGLAWWAACGALVGLAACAFAPRAPSGSADPVPVRFMVSVRDGWTSGLRGWGTRVRVLGIERAGVALPHARELELYVSAPVGRAELPAPGTRWEGSGDLVSDPHLPLKAGYLRVKSLLLLRQNPGGSPVDRLREAGVQALQASAGVDPVRLHAAGLASALVLERRETLLEGEVASMRRSGLVHLLSVSGLHVGLVAVLAWGALNLVGVRPRARRWLVIVALIAFALLAGGNAPVRRAATAGVAYLLARQLGRPLEPLPTVWAIVAGLVALEPAVVLQPGFELSAFVTLALVRWISPLALALPVLPTRLAQALAVAVVAQAASSPLVGEYFAVVPPLGVLANLLAAPLELLLVGASLLALAVAPIWSWLGGLVLLAVAGGRWLLGLASAVGGIVSWPFPPLPTVLAALLGGLALTALTRARAALAAALLLVSGTLVWMLLPAPGSPWTHRVRVLAVRDGMAVLIESGKTAVLIDTGRSTLDAWRELARVRVRHLEALVVTHPDADHTGGAAMLLERLRVGRFCYPRALGDRGEIVSLRRAARLAGADEIPLTGGERVAIAAIGCDVLWPPPVMEGADNDASLVARFPLGGAALLVTGDLEAAGEAALMSSGAALRAELLQLPHHGSRTSTTPAFLEAVMPVVAFAATGTHPRFAYPDHSVARRVRDLPAVMATQEEGVVSVAWGEHGAFTLGTARQVRVSRHRGPARE